MSDTAVGKNNMPTYHAPVKILRPGDPGFPADAGEPVGKQRNCEHPGCGKAYVPRVPGIRYCLLHNTPEAAKERADGMVRSNDRNAAKPPKPPKGSRRNAAVRILKTERPCQHEGCGAMFLPKHVDSRYCEEHSAKKYVQRRSNLRRQGRLAPVADMPPVTSSFPPSNVVEKQEVQPPPHTPAKEISVFSDAHNIATLRSLARIYRSAADLIDQAAATLEHSNQPPQGT